MGLRGNWVWAFLGKVLRFAILEFGTLDLEFGLALCTSALTVSSEAKARSLHTLDKEDCLSSV